MKDRFREEIDGVIKKHLEGYPDDRAKAVEEILSLLRIYEREQLINELVGQLQSALGSLAALCGVKPTGWRKEIMDKIQQAISKAERRD